VLDKEQVAIARRRQFIQMQQAERAAAAANNSCGSGQNGNGISRGNARNVRTEDGENDHGTEDGASQEESAVLRSLWSSSGASTISGAFHHDVTRLPSSSTRATLNSNTSRCGGSSSGYRFSSSSRSGNAYYDEGEGAAGSAEAAAALAARVLAKRKGSSSTTAAMSNDFTAWNSRSSNGINGKIGIGSSGGSPFDHEDSSTNNNSSAISSQALLSAIAFRNNSNSASSSTSTSAPTPRRDDEDESEDEIKMRGFMEAVVTFLREEGGILHGDDSRSIDKSSSGSSSSNHRSGSNYETMTSVAASTMAGVKTAAVLRRFREVPDQDALLFK